MSCRAQTAASSLDGRTVDRFVARLHFPGKERSERSDGTQPYLRTGMCDSRIGQAATRTKRCILDRTGSYPAVRSTGTGENRSKRRSDRDAKNRIEPAERSRKGLRHADFDAGSDRRLQGVPMQHSMTTTAFVIDGYRVKRSLGVVRGI